MNIETACKELTAIAETEFAPYHAANGYIVPPENVCRELKAKVFQVLGESLTPLDIYKAAAENDNDKLCRFMFFVGF